MEPDFRIGEAERNVVCDRLSQAYAAGQLSNVELEERLARAVTARTRSDAQSLVRDLAPAAVVASAPPSRPAAARQASWTGYDVFAVILLLGCTMAVCGMMLAAASIDQIWFLCAVVGGTFATGAGASGAHLLHRAAQRRRRSVGGPAA